MKYAFTHGKLLDGTKDMQVQEGLCVLTDGERISAIVPEGTPLDGYTVVDLQGRYLMPGLINMHVHLAGSGKPQKKQRDSEKLVRTILSTALTRKIAYQMVCGFARTELMSGVTTIRTVGGLADFDTRLRDEIAAGRRVGPRILAANEGISVPGGHMAGSVAVAAHSIPEALAQLDAAEAQGVDLIKLMITGGVMDAKEKGLPGEMKMPPEMIKAVCARAHAAGYRVAAHVESPQGVRAALENGVDSIEHGAKPDAEILRLLKDTGAFLCTTISPCPTRCLTVPSPTRLRSSSTTARSSLRASSTARRPRLPTTFPSCSATTSAARGSPSMISGASCFISTNIPASPTPSLSTPQRAGARSSPASAARPAPLRRASAQT